MSAPVANPAVTANAAPQAAGGLVGRSAGTSPAPAGFEALLAVLLPVGAPQAAAAGFGKIGQGATKSDQPKTKDADPGADLTAVQAQLAALLAQASAAVTPATKTATVEGQPPQTLPTAPKTADLLAALKDETQIPPVPASGQTAGARTALAALSDATLAPPPVQPATPPKPAPPQALASVAAPPALAPPQAPTVAPVAAQPSAETQAVVVAKAEKPDQLQTNQLAHVPAQAAAPQAAAPQGSAQAVPTQTVVAALAAQSGGEGAGQDRPDQRNSQASSDDGAPDAAALPAAGQPGITHMIQAQAAAVATRGSPETVAKLAAQIIKKLEARTSRFDIALDPVGMGKVDVKVEIGAQGQMTAALSFDSAQSAADLRGRAGELRAALEQAGFDLGSGGLSFSFSGQGGETSKQAFAEPDRRSATRILQATTTADAPLTVASRSPFDSRSSGVDVRI